MYKWNQIYLPRGMGVATTRDTRDIVPNHFQSLEND